MSCYVPPLVFIPRTFQTCHLKRFGVGGGHKEEFWVFGNKAVSLSYHLCIHRGCAFNVCAELTVSARTLQAQAQLSASLRFRPAPPLPVRRHFQLLT